MNNLQRYTFDKHSQPTDTPDGEYYRCEDVDSLFEKNRDYWIEKLKDYQECVDSQGKEIDMLRNALEKGWGWEDVYENQDSLEDLTK